MIKKAIMFVVLIGMLLLVACSSKSSQTNDEHNKNSGIQDSNQTTPPEDDESDIGEEGNSNQTTPSEDDESDIKEGEGSTNTILPEVEYFELPRPTTNLEFWIGENVHNVDFSEHIEKNGLIGAREYYGMGYVPTQKNDYQVDPKECVIYTVSKYPDYSSKHRHITGIYITDPNVEFYGISVNSTVEEFLQRTAEHGFVPSNDGTNECRVENGPYRIFFNGERIFVSVEITNKEGIAF